MIYFLTLRFFFLLVTCSFLAESAPVQESNARQPRQKGCYYLSDHYDNGERIDTNEPCLNCTCLNSMLMCYLRICPFVKPVGEECIIEREEGDCCPKIWCPEVIKDKENTPKPVEKRKQQPGCYLDEQYYPDGAMLPHDPKRPCEVCYCIRNTTACVMQECELKVDGCFPIYKEGQCCPCRYNCTYEEATPTPPGVTLMELAEGCTLPDGSFVEDGEAVNSTNPCEHCYCMRNEVVCAIQECQAPGDNCRPVPPKPDQCCPDRYECLVNTISPNSFEKPISLQFSTVFTTSFTTTSPDLATTKGKIADGSKVKGAPKKEVVDEIPSPVYIPPQQTKTTETSEEVFSTQPSSSQKSSISTESHIKEDDALTSTFSDSPSEAEASTATPKESLLPDKFASTSTKKILTEFEDSSVTSFFDEKSSEFSSTHYPTSSPTHQSQQTTIRAETINPEEHYKKETGQEENMKPLGYSEETTIQAEISSTTEYFKESTTEEDTRSSTEYSAQTTILPETSSPTKQPQEHGIQGEISSTKDYSEQSTTHTDIKSSTEYSVQTTIYPETSSPTKQHQQQDIQGEISSTRDYSQESTTHSDAESSTEHSSQTSIHAGTSSPSEQAQQTTDQTEASHSPEKSQETTSETKPPRKSYGVKGSSHKFSSTHAPSASSENAEVPTKSFSSHETSSPLGFDSSHHFSSTTQTPKEIANSVKESTFEPPNIIRVKGRRPSRPTEESVEVSSAEPTIPKESESGDGKTKQPTGVKSSQKKGHIKGKRPQKPLLMGVIPGEKKQSGSTTTYPSVKGRPFVMSIPGEGSCHVGKVSYRHGQAVPSSDVCKKRCECTRGKIYCVEIVCEVLPPESFNDCQIVRNQNQCCPHYECGTSITKPAEYIEITEFTSVDGIFVSSTVDPKTGTYSTESSSVFPVSSTESPVVNELVFKKDVTTESSYSSFVKESATYPSSSTLSPFSTSTTEISHSSDKAEVPTAADVKDFAVHEKDSASTHEEKFSTEQSHTEEEVRTTSGPKSHFSVDETSQEVETSSVRYDSTVEDLIFTTQETFTTEKEHAESTLDRSSTESAVTEKSHSVSAVFEETDSIAPKEPSIVPQSVSTVEETPTTTFEDLTEKKIVSLSTTTKIPSSTSFVMEEQTEKPGIGIHIDTDEKSATPSDVTSISEVITESHTQSYSVGVTEGIHTSETSEETSTHSSVSSTKISIGPETTDRYNDKDAETTLVYHTSSEKEETSFVTSSKPSEASDSFEDSEKLTSFISTNEESSVTLAPEEAAHEVDSEKLTSVISTHEEPRVTQVPEETDHEADSEKLTTLKTVITSTHEESRTTPSSEEVTHEEESDSQKDTSTQEKFTFPTTIQTGHSPTQTTFVDFSSTETPQPTVVDLSSTEKHQPIVAETVVTEDGGSEYTTILVSSSESESPEYIPKTVIRDDVTISGLEHVSKTASNVETEGSHLAETTTVVPKVDATVLSETDFNLHMQPSSTEKDIDEIETTSSHPVQKTTHQDESTYASAEGDIVHFTDVPVSHDVHSATMKEHDTSDSTDRTTEQSHSVKSTDIQGSTHTPAITLEDTEEHEKPKTVGGIFEEHAVTYSTEKEQEVTTFKVYKQTTTDVYDTTRTTENFQGTSTVKPIEDGFASSVATSMEHELSHETIGVADSDNVKFTETKPPTVSTTESTDISSKHQTEAGSDIIHTAELIAPSSKVAESSTVFSLETSDKLEETTSKQEIGSDAVNSDEVESTSLSSKASTTPSSINKETSHFEETAATNKIDIASDISHQEEFTSPSDSGYSAETQTESPFHDHKETPKPEEETDISPDTLVLEDEKTTPESGAAFTSASHELDYDTKSITPISVSVSELDNTISDISASVGGTSFINDEKRPPSEEILNPIYEITDSGISDDFVTEFAAIDESSLESESIFSKKRPGADSEEDDIKPKDHATQSHVESIKPEQHSTESHSETVEPEQYTTESYAEDIQPEQHTTESHVKAINSEHPSTESHTEAIDSEQHTSVSHVESIKPEQHTTESHVEAISSKQPTTESHAEAIEPKQYTTKSHEEDVKLDQHTTESHVEIISSEQTTTESHTEAIDPEQYTTKSHEEEIKSDQHTTESHVELIISEEYTTESLAEAVEPEQYTTLSHVEYIKPELSTTESHAEAVEPEQHTTVSHIENIKHEQHTTVSHPEEIKPEHHTTESHVEDNELEQYTTESHLKVNKPEHHITEFPDEAFKPESGTSEPHEETVKTQEVVTHTAELTDEDKEIHISPESNESSSQFPGIQETSTHKPEEDVYITDGEDYGHKKVSSETSDSHDDRIGTTQGISEDPKKSTEDQFEKHKPQGEGIIWLYDEEKNEIYRSTSAPTSSSGHESSTHEETSVPPSSVQPDSEGYSVTTVKSFESTPSKLDHSSDSMTPDASTTEQDSSSTLKPETIPHKDEGFKPFSIESTSIPIMIIDETSTHDEEAIQEKSSAPSTILPYEDERTTQESHQSTSTSDEQPIEGETVNDIAEEASKSITHGVHFSEITEYHSETSDETTASSTDFHHETSRVPGKNTNIITDATKAPNDFDVSSSAPENLVSIYVTGSTSQEETEASFSTVKGIDLTHTSPKDIVHNLDFTTHAPAQDVKETPTIKFETTEKPFTTSIIESTTTARTEVSTDFEETTVAKDSTSTQVLQDATHAIAEFVHDSHAVGHTEEEETIETFTDPPKQTEKPESHIKFAHSEKPSVSVEEITSTATGQTSTTTEKYFEEKVAITEAATQGDDNSYYSSKAPEWTSESEKMDTHAMFSTVVPTVVPSGTSTFPAKFETVSQTDQAPVLFETTQLTMKEGSLAEEEDSKEEDAESVTLETKEDEFAVRTTASSHIHISHASEASELSTTKPFTDKSSINEDSKKFIDHTEPHVNSETVPTTENEEQAISFSSTPESVFLEGIQNATETNSTITDADFYEHVTVSAQIDEIAPSTSSEESKDVSEIIDTENKATTSGISELSTSTVSSPEDEKVETSFIHVEKDLMTTEHAKLPKITTAIPEISESDSRPTESASQTSDSSSSTEDSYLAPRIKVTSDEAFDYSSTVKETATAPTELTTKKHIDFPSFIHQSGNEVDDSTTEKSKFDFESEIQTSSMIVDDETTSVASDVKHTTNFIEQSEETDESFEEHTEYTSTSTVEPVNVEKDHHAPEQSEETDESLDEHAEYTSTSTVEPLNIQKDHAPEQNEETEETLDEHAKYTSTSTVEPINSQKDHHAPEQSEETDESLDEHEEYTSTSTVVPGSEIKDQSTSTASTTVGVKDGTIHSTSKTVYDLITSTPKPSKLDAATESQHFTSEHFQMDAETEGKLHETDKYLDISTVQEITDMKQPTTPPSQIENEALEDLVIKKIIEKQEDSESAGYEDSKERSTTTVVKEFTTTITPDMTMKTTGSKQLNSDISAIDSITIPGETPSPSTYSPETTSDIQKDTEDNFTNSYSKTDAEHSTTINYPQETDHISLITVEAHKIFESTEEHLENDTQKVNLPENLLTDSDIMNGFTFPSDSKHPSENIPDITHTSLTHTTDQILIQDHGFHKQTYPPEISEEELEKIEEIIKEFFSNKSTVESEETKSSDNLTTKSIVDILSLSETDSTETSLDKHEIGTESVSATKESIKDSDLSISTTLNPFIPENLIDSSMVPSQEGSLPTVEDNTTYINQDIIEKKPFVSTSTEVNNLDESLNISTSTIYEIENKDTTTIKPKVTTVPEKPGFETSYSSSASSTQDYGFHKEVYYPPKHEESTHFVPHYDTTERPSSFSALIDETVTQETEIPKFSVHSESTFSSITDTLIGQSVAADKKSTTNFAITSLDESTATHTDSSTEESTDKIVETSSHDAKIPLTFSDHSSSTFSTSDRPSSSTESVPGAHSLDKFEIKHTELPDSETTMSSSEVFTSEFTHGSSVEDKIVADHTKEEIATEEPHFDMNSDTSAQTILSEQTEKADESLTSTVTEPSIATRKSTDYNYLYTTYISHDSSSIESSKVSDPFTTEKYETIDTKDQNVYANEVHSPIHGESDDTLSLISDTTTSSNISKETTSDRVSVPDASEFLKKTTLKDSATQSSSDAGVHSTEYAISSSSVTSSPKQTDIVSTDVFKYSTRPSQEILDLNHTKLESTISTQDGSDLDTEFSFNDGVSEHHITTKIDESDEIISKKLPSTVFEEQFSSVSTQQNETFTGIVQETTKTYGIKNETEVTTDISEAPSTAVSIEAIGFSGHDISSIHIPTSISFVTSSDVYENSLDQETQPVGVEKVYDIESFTIKETVSNHSDTEIVTDGAFIASDSWNLSEDYDKSVTTKSSISDDETAVTEENRAHSSGSASTTIKHEEDLTTPHPQTSSSTTIDSRESSSSRPQEDVTSSSHDEISSTTHADILETIASFFPHSSPPSILYESHKSSSFSSSSTTSSPSHKHTTAKPADDSSHHFPEDGGYCLYENEIYNSAEQIPRKDPCEFCFCFRGDIICLQQSCPPPIRGCYATPINGFCCPRFHCPVQEMHFNLSTTTTTTPDPRVGKYLPPADQSTGCEIEGNVYRVHQVVRPSSGPCMLCRCEMGGIMKCDPRDCQPQAPLLLRLNREFFKKR